MKKYILSFICDLEGYKTAIKQLHWDANSLSQHQLCDDIATIISDYQDKVSEVEQSISGRLPINNLKGTPYKITNLKKFVEDVISGVNSFYSKLKKEGDKYIGMRSDTEAVLSDLQRQLYLVDFTVKESLKERLRNKINEDRVTITDGKHNYSLTENELREFVSEAVKNIKDKENMKKQIIKLTEGDLHKIIKESVNKILEGYTGDFGYTDDPNYNKFAKLNKPTRMQTTPLVSNRPKRLGGNLSSFDNGESYIWDDNDWSDEEIESRTVTDANMDDYPV
jgi:hypothetical protein